MSLVIGSEAVVAMHPDEAQEHALNIYIPRKGRCANTDT